MNKHLLIMSAALLVAGSAFAQNYDQANPDPNIKTLKITSGFDADVVAQGTPIDGQFIKGVDNSSVGFFTKTFDNKVTDFSGIDINAFPLTGPSGSQYTFDVTQKNALSLSAVPANENREARATTGTLTLKTPIKTNKIYFLATAGNGPAGLDVVVNYADGSDPAQNVSVLDWWDKSTQANCVKGGLDRADRIDNRTDLGGHVTLLEYGIKTDENSEIQSITFTMSDANDQRVITILGLSANGTPLEISDGLTDDVIAEAMPLKETTTIGVDRSQWVIVATGIDFSTTKNCTYGFPDDGKIITKPNSGNNFGGITFQCADYSGVNATRLTVDDANTADIDESTAVLEIEGAPMASVIYLIGTAGNGPANLQVTYTYTDGTTEDDINGCSLLDWCNKQSEQNYTTGRYSNGVDDKDYAGLYVAELTPSQVPLKSITLHNTGAASNQSKAIVFAASMIGEFTTTAINDIEAEKVSNGKIFNAAGQQVDKSYKGLVIKNGKKYIAK